MKQKFIVFFLSCLFTLSGLMAWPALVGFAQNHSDLNAKIASVNGVLITKKDFIWAYSSEEQRLTSMGKILSPDEIRDLKKVIFDHLLNREILFQESQKKKIQVSELKVEEEYSKIRAAMMSDIDLNTIEKELDIRENDIKNEFRRVFAIEMLLDQELRIDNTVTEKEAKDFYEKNPDKFIALGPARFSHILIQVKEGADNTQKAKAKKKIEAIAGKLKKGQDFAELAKSYSEDESSRAVSGDIGWVKIGRTVKPFEDAAFALNPGEVSGVVETPYGYHLIKMLEKKPETVFSFKDVKEQIVEYLKNIKKNKSQSDYIENIKKGSKIDRFMDPMQIQ
jgi:peptidyl-prolyl cis-trans isomerase C